MSILKYHNLFLSSRRRHTRSKRDWSSDVCSSDLHNQKLKEACRTLREYAVYTDKVRKYVEEMELADAVERAIRECIAEEIGRASCREGVERRVDDREGKQSKEKIAGHNE